MTKTGLSSKSERAAKRAARNTVANHSAARAPASRSTAFRSKRAPAATSKHFARTSAVTPPTQNTAYAAI